MNNSTNIANIPPTNYECETCSIICHKLSDWNRHLLTKKHHVNIIGGVSTNSLICECGNSYKERTGLWKHRKKCVQYNINKNMNTNEPLMIDTTTIPDLIQKDNLVEYLIKENAEFKTLIMELIKKDHNTINNTNVNSNNNNNNSFNLNLFLYEKCKDAINISDFVDNIKMKLSDLETFGHMGYVEGVSRIIIRNLKDLDTYSRPIHCSDLKREVFYIKDDDKWSKEDDDKMVLKNAIKQVANKNIKQITEWTNLNPDCKKSDSRKNDQYLKIVMNSMSGGSNDEQHNNISHIVKNVAKEVVIEK